ncbi:MAG: methylated-DNA--[protein]-cysteine S-methyltransferase [Anaerolineales bacterium]|nr:methylated-DNA--[protein]-cysteine S-methyltransferase [Anaerolineales bacterium]
MDHKDEKFEREVAFWLGDEEGAITGDELLHDLDSLFAQGPEKNEIAQAQSRLDETLRVAGDTAIYYDILQRTPVGQVLVAVSNQGVVGVEIGMSERAFIDHVSSIFNEPILRSKSATSSAFEQLQEYFDGKRKVFDLPVSLNHLTPFQRRVLEATMEISFGSVSTYGEMARNLGKHRAARAVGQALARNPIPIVIPCHRVLGSDGGLHGYSGGEGIRTKKFLLQFEGAYGQ